MEFELRTLLAVTVAVAAVTDLLRERIPNWLTMPATVLALCLHSVTGGATGVLWGLGGWLAGFALFIPMYAAGGMGAGDVKLIATVGACAGPYRVLWISMYAAALGGIYALGIVIYSMVTRGGWADAGKRLRLEGQALFLTGGDVQPLSESLRSYPRLRYAIVVALGVALEQVVGAPQF